MTRPCASLLCSRAVSPVAMPAHAVGNPGRPGRATWPPPRAFSSIAAMYPVLASATAPAISGALSTRPQRRRPSLAGFKEVSYYHRVTPCGPGVTVHEGHPVVAGVASANGRQRWGRCISGDEGPLVSGERPVLTQVRSMGPVDPVFSHALAPALAWTLNKYTPAKGV